MLLGRWLSLERELSRPPVVQGGMTRGHEVVRRFAEFLKYGLWP